MQWLKRQLLLWRMRRALEDRPFNRHAPDRERIVAMLNLLRQEQFTNYHPDQGMAVKAKLLYRTVEEFITKLHEVEAELQMKQYVQGAQVPYGRQEIALEHYLVTRDGYIYEVKHSVLVFKHYSLGICKILDEQSKSENSSFYEHNTRVLTHILGDMDELAKSFLKIACLQGV